MFSKYFFKVLILILNSETTFSQGSIVKLTFESNTIFTASTYCLKLYSRLSLYPSSLPPNQIISILFTILGSFLIAKAILVIAPIPNI